jgi:hypothetical protein
MIRLVEVKPRKNYRLWLKYEDGTSGEVDLSSFAGRGVFSAWKESEVFEDVRITEEGALAWPGGIDICADALYLRLTDKSPAEVFPRLRDLPVHT